MVFDIDKIKEVDPKEALELENESYIFLDVREQSEWDAGHYKNSTFLPKNLPKNTPKILYQKSKF